MIDPYQVLGIERSASQDEIKKAYRVLSRKYHPDANINNPNKEQAEEKFKEIQQAYKQIMDEKENGYQNSYNNGNFGDNFDSFGAFNNSYSNQNNAGFSEEYMMHLKAAANYINSHYYNEALNVLAQMEERSSQWYYLSALANSGIGNNILALEHARQAAAMETGNLQYSQLVHQLEAGNNWYQSMQNPYGTPSTSGNGMCMHFCFAYMCCNVFIGSSPCCHIGYFPNL